VKCSDGRVERISTCGLNRIVKGGAALSAGAAGSSVDAEGRTVGEFATTMPAIGSAEFAGAGDTAEDARFLVMTRRPLLLGSEVAAAVEVKVRLAPSRLSPLRPCIVGIQPCSCACTAVDEPATACGDAVAVLSRSALVVSVPGDEVDLANGWDSAREP
jgi:hypothetical protein